MFLEYHDVMPELSAPLTLKIAKSGLRKTSNIELCPCLFVLSSIKQLTQSSLQLAFVNPACLAAFPLKRGGIINTSLEDIPPAEGNILALSLNQQWGGNRADWRPERASRWDEATTRHCGQRRPELRPAPSHASQACCVVITHRSRSSR